MDNLDSSSIDDLIYELAEVLHEILHVNYNQYIDRMISELDILSIDYINFLLFSELMGTGALAYIFEDTNDMKLLNLLVNKIEKSLEHGRLSLDLILGIGHALANSTYKGRKVHIFNYKAVQLLKKEIENTDNKIWRGFLIIILGYIDVDESQRKNIAKFVENLFFENVESDQSILISTLTALSQLLYGSGDIELYEKLKPFLRISNSAIKEIVLRTIGYIFKGTNNKQVVNDIRAFLFDTEDTETVEIAKEVLEEIKK